MIYDVFISHASEDKDGFVRELAERLRHEQLAVWYDEFSLNVGDSLRQSIDRGLAESKFGIVILSPNFFSKQWPQWELDGLVARQISSTINVILPIWHNVSHGDVLAYSPPLADRLALNTSLGMDQVVAGLKAAIRPTDSVYMFARNHLIKSGMTPPVSSEDWWIDAASLAGSYDLMTTDLDDWDGDNARKLKALGTRGRWAFPLPPDEGDPLSRGFRLAQAGLQMEWQATAREQNITQITPPNLVHDFLTSSPALLRTCREFPVYAITHAPQLAIRGFGGPIEDVVELAYRRSRESYIDLHPSFALRALDPIKAHSEPSATIHFVQGDELSLGGTSIRHFQNIDYLAWMLSAKSAWLPSPVREFLVRGFADWPVWTWPGRDDIVDDYSSVVAGALKDALESALTDSRKFELSEAAARDLYERLDQSRRLLSLPETGAELAARFLSSRLIEGYLASDYWVQVRGVRRRGLAK